MVLWNMSEERCESSISLTYPNFHWKNLRNFYFSSRLQYVLSYNYFYSDVPGFSPPHELFSPELGHGTDFVSEHHEHPTSYMAEGHSESELDGFEVQQPIDVALGQGEPTTIEDTRNEVKIIWDDSTLILHTKIVWMTIVFIFSVTDCFIYFIFYS